MQINKIMLNNNKPLLITYLHKIQIIIWINCSLEHNPQHFQKQIDQLV